MHLALIASEVRRTPLAHGPRLPINIHACTQAGNGTERYVTWLHRDLKPSNIMLSGNPFGDSKPIAKLIDFGLSYQKEQGGRSRVSEKAGTDAYASPEKFNKQQYDERDDVWAMGCLIFDCVTLRPFESATHGANLQDNEKYRETLIKEVAKPAPQLQKLLEGCWEQTPDRRPDAATLVETLNEAFVLDDGEPKLKPIPRAEEPEQPVKEEPALPPMVVPQPSANEPLIVKRVRVTVHAKDQAAEPRLSRQTSLGKRFAMASSFKDSLSGFTAFSRPGTPASEKIVPLSATHVAAAEGNGAHERFERILLPFFRPSPSHLESSG